LDGDQHVPKAVAYTWQHKHKKSGQTVMPRVGFESAISVLEQAKVFHALGRAGTVIGIKMNKNVHFPG
jgi:hypothetical protein